jgi:Lon protease-like protein
VAEIGLFPLGIVLLPQERVPLHIFEERYKELIGECLERDREFGIVFTDEDGIRRTGTLATVVEVLRRLPDGRMDIIVEGRRRFRVGALTEGRSFTTAEVADHDDEEEDVPSAEEVAACVEAFRRVEEAAGTEEAELDPVESVAFQIAGRVDFGAQVKQELLESRSERERLSRLTELLEGAVEKVRAQRLARERAPGNGHVPP